MPSYFSVLQGGEGINILAVDQARHGAWSVFDYETKKLLDYGTWSFENYKYTFEQAILCIEELICDVIHTHDIGAVFFEDIQMQRNALSFKRLAQLQGVLVNLCEKNNYLYGLVSPSKWQNYCNARGRTAREAKVKVTTATPVNSKKKSKILSLQAAKDLYGVKTENDNLADAVMIGHYVVHNIEIKGNDSLDKKGS